MKYQGIKDYVNDELNKIKAQNENRASYDKSNLLILQIGDDSASNTYIKGKLKDCERTGTSATLVKVTNGDYESAKKILSLVGKNYTGIIIQKPSVMTAEEEEIFKQESRAMLRNIRCGQDIDGFKSNSFFSACTPKGIMDFLSEHAKIDIKGKRVAVVGVGDLVGKPLVPMLIEQGATVFTCNSKTKNLKEITLMSDIIISAVGKINLITPDMVNDHALVIDAGINFNEEGKMVGDCDPRLYEDQYSCLVTPVPGGVGLLTRLALQKNLLNSNVYREDKGK